MRYCPFKFRCIFFIKLSRRTISDGEKIIIEECDDLIDYLKGFNKT